MGETFCCHIYHAAIRINNWSQKYIIKIQEEEYFVSVSSLKERLFFFLWVENEMKVFSVFFAPLPSIVLYLRLLTFECLGEILNCDHSKENY